MPPLWGSGDATAGGVGATRWGGGGADDGGAGVAGNPFLVIGPPAGAAGAGRVMLYRGVDGDAVVGRAGALLSLANGDTTLLRCVALSADGVLPRDAAFGGVSGAESFRATTGGWTGDAWLLRCGVGETDAPVWSVATRATSPGAGEAVAARGGEGVGERAVPVLTSFPSGSDVLVLATDDCSCTTAGATCRWEDDGVTDAFILRGGGARTLTYGDCVWWIIGDDGSGILLLCTASGASVSCRGM